MFASPRPTAKRWSLRRYTACCIDAKGPALEDDDPTSAAGVADLGLVGALRLTLRCRARGLYLPLHERAGPPKHVCGCSATGFARLPPGTPSTPAPPPDRGGGEVPSVGPSSVILAGPASAAGVGLDRARCPGIGPSAHILLRNGRGVRGGLSLLVWRSSVRDLASRGPQHPSLTSRS